MGPGILTRYSKQVLGSFLVVFAILAAVMLYFRFRGSIGGVSPHETVNDLYEWEHMTFEAEMDEYPADVDTIRLYFRNDAPDGVVWLSSKSSFAYELEYRKDGVWHQMRPVVDHPRWSNTDGIPTNDIVNGNGGEITLRCGISQDYPTPLQAGRYRIVIPGCEHIQHTPAALAAEFEVR